MLLVMTNYCQRTSISHRFNVAYTLLCTGTLHEPKQLKEFLKYDIEKRMGNA